MLDTKMVFIDALKFKRMQKQLKASFSKIKSEFDEQREAINENTNEIQSNFEYLDELSKKVDKLSERIDELSLYISKITNTLDLDTTEIKEQRYEQQSFSLTRREKEVFSALYIMCEQNINPSLKRLSTRLGYTTEMTKNYLLQLMDKGIPISMSQEDDEIIIDLDPSFRRVQTKKNILGLDSSIMSQFID